MYEIISDHKAMTITVAEKVFTEPDLYRRTNKQMDLKAEILPDCPHKEGESEWWKWYGEQLGAKFNRRFQAANYYLWLGDKYELRTAQMFRRWGSSWKKYDDGLVARAYKVRGYVNEAERDGLHNLIPAIVSMQASPKEIRLKVGGATWRRIAHASKTRNMKLMQTASRITYANPETFGDVFLRLMDFPSGVLGAVWETGEEAQMAARLTPRKNPIGYTDTHQTIKDARRMIGTINHDWSLARVKHEHDEAVRRELRKEYSPVTFTEQWAIEDGGFTGALLCSPYDIAEEGGIMHHCVSIYGNLAANGEYAVVRIEGDERATAGYRWRNGWHLEQVYGACNAHVTEQCQKFAQMVAAKLPVSKANRPRVAA